jgi:iron complex outermembrane receptor protein
MRHLSTLLLLTSVALPVLGQAQTPDAPAAASRSHQRGGTIRGIIRTSDGKPAAFVSVGIPKSGKGANTAEDGSFQITGVEPGTHELQVSYVGLQPQQQTVTVAAGQTTKADFALSESSAQLNEVVVTGGAAIINRPASASKGGIAPLDLPQSTAVVTSTVIADQQVNRLGDVLKNVSGVSLTQQRQGVAETFSARGYSIGVAGAGGSIFKNGLISNTQGFPDASTLESVEVLKGSSALLYGNVSGGLIINMVTKKPRYDWGGSVEMRAGSYSFYKPIVDIYGPISKNLAFRVVGTYENGKSFRNVVKSNRLYVNPSLLYKIGDKTDILVQGDYLKSNITPDAGIGILNSGTDAQFTPGTDRARFINAVWAYNKTDQFSGSVVVNHRFSDTWRLNAIAGIQDTQVNGFGVGVPMNIAGYNVSAKSKLRPGDFARSLSAVKSGERDYNGQLNLTGKFDTGFLGHQLLVGGDALRIVSKSAGTFSYRSASGSTSAVYDTINILDRSRRVERTDQPDFAVVSTTTSPSYRFGAYVQDLITIVPKLKVLAGVRYSYQNVLQTTINNQVTGVETRGVNADKSDKAFSPKAAIIYQPLANVSLYGSYTNNFITNAGLLDINSEPLKPSIVNQYEAGVKSELFSTRIFTNLSVYRYRNSNFAQAVIVNGTPSAQFRELTGETTSDGLDLDVNGNFSKNFYFNVGYGYNYMRYTNTSGATGSQVEGERLINNPAHTANGSVFYTFDHPSLRGLKLGASAFYTGQRFGGLNNTVNQAPAYNRLVSLSGFTTVDISAGYTYQRFSILAKLSNIGNTLNYVVHDRYSINPIPPRQFLTTVAYRF